MRGAILFFSPAPQAKRRWGAGTGGAPRAQGAGAPKGAAKRRATSRKHGSPEERLQKSRAHAMIQASSLVPAAGAQSGRARMLSTPGKAVAEFGPKRPAWMPFGLSGPRGCFRYMLFCVFQRLSCAVWVGGWGVFVWGVVVGRVRVWDGSVAL
ncbi:hypothetical protein TraAM80_01337 [Trypanosoma rangeli]|uniref:Uncharacterized protein n=1 Tax=Trypanosoma rangeli TaxID=5698 RepID=A0A3R7M828_TRYRA|nr:uncharacterized protein TraAM80_01337 [Trypanosoma rangeli]RNF10775.1 hypothetical protein TraAM80_01337 [Trypanosoma rangeli]|eukprot:RNF10775.1 hypothetical protein TraAM80_01337 [Trypanosoma rangeli]